MRHFGYYLGFSLQAEVILLTILGICVNIFDYSVLELNYNLHRVWTACASLDPERFTGRTAQAIKYILTGVVFTRTLSVHLYLAFYIVMLWPVIFEDKPGLMLPWLVVGGIKCLGMGAVTMFVGLYTCSVYGEFKPACLDFVLAHIVEHAPSLYMWFIIFSFYHELKCVLKIISSAEQHAKQEFETEMISRRRKARSLEDKTISDHGRSFISDETMESLLFQLSNQLGDKSSRSLDTLVGVMAAEAEKEEILSIYDELAEDKKMSLAERAAKLLKITAFEITEAQKRKAARMGRAMVSNLDMDLLLAKMDSSDSDLESTFSEMERKIRSRSRSVDMGRGQVVQVCRMESGRFEVTADFGERMAKRNVDEYNDVGAGSSRITEDEGGYSECSIFDMGLISTRYLKNADYNDPDIRQSIKENFRSNFRESVREPSAMHPSFFEHADTASEETKKPSKSIYKFGTSSFAGSATTESLTSDTKSVETPKHLMIKNWKPSLIPKISKVHEGSKHSLEMSSDSSLSGSSTTSKSRDEKPNSFSLIPRRKKRNPEKESGSSLSSSISSKESKNESNLSSDFPTKLIKPIVVSLCEKGNDYSSLGFSLDTVSGKNLETSENSVNATFLADDEEPLISLREKSSSSLSKPSEEQIPKQREPRTVCLQEKGKQAIQIQSPKNDSTLEHPTTPLLNEVLQEKHTQPSSKHPSFISSTKRTPPQPMCKLSKLKEPIVTPKSSSSKLSATRGRKLMPRCKYLQEMEKSSRSSRDLPRNPASIAGYSADFACQASSDLPDEKKKCTSTRRQQEDKKCRYKQDGYTKAYLAGPGKK